MQIKRFEARDMTEALRLVKREFGSDAVILSAKSLKNDKGIFSPLKKHGVEVTAATDSYYQYANKQNIMSKFRHHDKNEQRNGFVKEATENIQRRPTHGILGAFRSKHRPAYERIQNDKNGYSKLFALYQQMLFQGVSSHIALELIGTVNRAALSNGLFENEEIKPFLVSILEDMGLRTCRIRVRGGKQRIAAFIGPTGTGKTTTIAKLVAGAKAMKKKNSIALITVDTHRIAGIAQLKVYAKIMGIPMEVASNNKELKESIKKFRDKDLIFVDTAGVGNRNEHQINEIRRILEDIHSLEIHILLSASTKDKDLEDISKKFQAIPIDRLLFTKLDESITYGNILNHIFRTKIPISYFTNGQRIPEDIQGATLEKLVDLIINNEKELEYGSGLAEAPYEDITVFENLLKSMNNRQRVHSLQVI